MSELWNPELVSQARLEAMKDSIIYNLRTNSITFVEEKIRKTLNNMNDEETLMLVSKITAQINGKNAE